MKFKSIKEYTMEELFFSKSTFAIMTNNGTLYDECELLSNVGYGGIREFFFRTSGVIIAGSDVKSISFEVPSLDPQNPDNKVLKMYELGLGWRGCVICTAYSLEEAKAIMFANRDLDDNDLEDVQVRELKGYVYVNYGDE